MGSQDFVTETNLEGLVKRFRKADPAVRWKAADALSDLGAAGAEALINELGSPDPFVRDAAVYGLIGSNVAVEPLIQILLNDPNAMVRRHAANALREMDAVSASQALITAYHNDPDPGVRRQVVTALGEFGGDEADAVLITALADKGSEVRAKAAEFAGSAGNFQVVETLISLLNDPDKEVRNSAAYSLGEIEDIRAIEPLLNKLDDKDDLVRCNTIFSLAKLKAQVALPFLKEIQSKEAPKLIRKAVSEAIQIIEAAKE